MNREVEIDCFNCDGKGWIVAHHWKACPEQELCDCCKGKKKLIVPDEMAEELGEKQEDIRCSNPNANIEFVKKIIEDLGGERNE